MVSNKNNQERRADPVIKRGGLGSSYQEGGGWDPINWFNPVKCLCLSQVRILTYNVWFFYSMS